MTIHLVKRCYEAAVENGTAIPVVECTDSVRMITDSGNKILNRSKIRLVQTPQTFHSKILLPAFKIDYFIALWFFFQVLTGPVGLIVSNFSLISINSLIFFG